jgi:hypothetical protein
MSVDYLWYHFLKENTACCIGVFAKKQQLVLNIQNEGKNNDIPPSNSKLLGDQFRIT